MLLYSGHSAALAQMYNDGVQLSVYLKQARIICAGKIFWIDYDYDFKTIGQYLEGLAPHFKTTGQYLEGMAPHQDNWAVLGRFGAPSRQLGSTWKVWRPKQGNFP